MTKWLCIDSLLLSSSPSTSHIPDFHLGIYASYSLEARLQDKAIQEVEYVIQPYLNQSTTHSFPPSDCVTLSMTNRMNLSLFLVSMKAGVETEKK